HLGRLEERQDAFTESRAVDVVAFADFGRAAIRVLARRHRNEQYKSVLQYCDVRRFSGANYQLFQSRLRDCGEMSVREVVSSYMIELIREAIVAVFLLIDVANFLERIKQPINGSLCHPN